MSAKQDHGELILIKRHEEEEHEHHSSAWKVAHADFMTAMMAFFLILWLINVTDSDTRKAIANYFNPVDLAANTSIEKGLNDPSDLAAKGTSADGNRPSALKNTSGADLGAGDDRQQGDHERAAFQDPYAVLGRLAGEADPRAGGPPEAMGDLGSPGTGEGDLSRDPFDPAYRRSVPPRTKAPAGAPDKPTSGPASQATREAAARLLESELARALTPDGVHAPRLDVRTTADGLVIDLTDDIDYAMFPVGSAIPDGRLVRAMEQIARALQSRPGAVAVRGHTDGRPFRSATYDNWRLSSARAHMALYMLVRGGLDETRVVKIEGVADRDPKIPADPHAPQNRRIEILLRTPAS